MSVYAVVSYRAVAFVSSCSGQLQGCGLQDQHVPPQDGLLRSRSSEEPIRERGRDRERMREREKERERESERKKERVRKKEREKKREKERVRERKRE